MKTEEEKFLIKIGIAIKEARKKKKIKQYELANAIGVSPSHYCDMEHGKKIISILELWKIMKILGDEIFPSTKDEVKTLSSAYPDW